MYIIFNSLEVVLVSQLQGDLFCSNNIIIAYKYNRLYPHGSYGGGGGIKQHRIYSCNTIIMRCMKTITLPLRFNFILFDHTYNINYNHR